MFGTLLPGKTHLARHDLTVTLSELHDILISFYFDARKGCKKRSVLFSTDIFPRAGRKKKGPFFFRRNGRDNKLDNKLGLYEHLWESYLYPLQEPLFLKLYS